MKYIRKPINERVSAAIGIGIFLCAQFSWADTRTLLGEQELDSINAGASAVALAVANGFGGNISGALTGSNMSLIHISGPMSGAGFSQGVFALKHTTLQGGEDRPAVAGFSLWYV